MVAYDSPKYTHTDMLNNSFSKLNSQIKIASIEDKDLSPKRNKNPNKTFEGSVTTKA